MNSALEFAPWISLLGALWNVGLAVFVLTRNHRSEANIVFFCLGLAISIWNGCQALLFVTTDAAVALTGLRVMWLGIACGPVLLLHLSILTAERQCQKLLRGLYGICLSFAILAFTPYFIAGCRHVGIAGWYVVPGPLLFFYHPVFMLIVTSSLVILLIKRRTLPAFRHSRLDALILAQSLLFAAGLNDVLPIFGIDVYPFTDVPVFPYGSVLAAFYGLIVAYSVLQNQVLDVKLSISRHAAQLTRFAFVFCITLLFLLLAAILVPSAFTGTSIGLTLTAVILSTASASFFFPRLFGDGMQKVEQRILGDNFEYHDRVRSFISSMHLHYDRKMLFEELDDVLLNALKIQHYQIFVLDETRDNYGLYHSSSLSRASATDCGPSLIGHFVHGQADYMAATGPAHGRASRLVAARRELIKMGGDLAIALRTSDKLLGLIVIGKRDSNEDFSAADVHLLLGLATPLSLFIYQTRLKDQILQAQELDLLGRMSRGMAHDLNNLLTPVHTLLQLVTEGVKADDLNDLLPSAHRNVTTMRAYIREALFFSQNLRPDFQLGRLDVIIQNAVMLVRERAEQRRINVVVDDPCEARLEIDSVLIERLVTNLVANAIDASPPEETVHVSYVRLPAAERQRDWWRIIIEDAGPGIPKENLSRIFTPYFTTKKTGDESRGFGLGLAICRKIVHLHGGALNITSRKGAGTVVHVDLPTEQSNDPHSSARAV